MKFQSKNVYPEICEVGQSCSVPFNVDIERKLFKVIVYLLNTLLLYYFNIWFY